VFNPRTISKIASRRARLLHAAKGGNRSVPDARTISWMMRHLPLSAAKERGLDGGHIRSNMARGSISSHIAKSPIGTYKKAHAHGPARTDRALGRGLFTDVAAGEEPAAVDWRWARFIVPPNAWFTSISIRPAPARYLEFKHGTPRNARAWPMSWISPD